MEITKVQIHINKNENMPVKAFADIIIDNEFIVRGLGILKGREDIFYVTMPNKTRTDGSRQDVAHPISEDCRRYIENTVLDEYERVLNLMLQRSNMAPESPRS